jgi:AcrR family transcriptional regulator
MAVAKQNSVSVSHRQKNNRRRKEGRDARILRTRQRIDAAFVQLLHRRPYADIRVSDITRKACVGRATFYAHYSAKDDLLRSQFERIVAPMLIASANDPPFLDASPFFAHVRSAPHLYKALMGQKGGTAPRVLRDCFETRARKALSLDPGLTPVLKQAVLSRFVASSLLAITECWLEQGGHETPQQVQTLFANLVSPGLRVVVQLELGSA